MLVMNERLRHQTAEQRAVTQRIIACSLAAACCYLLGFVQLNGATGSGVLSAVTTGGGGGNGGVAGDAGGAAAESSTTSWPTSASLTAPPTAWATSIAFAQFAAANAFLWGGCVLSRRQSHAAALPSPGGLYVPPPSFSTSYGGGGRGGGGSGSGLLGNPTWDWSTTSVTVLGALQLLGVVWGVAPVTLGVFTVLQLLCYVARLRSTS